MNNLGDGIDIGYSTANCSISHNTVSGNRNGLFVSEQARENNHAHSNSIFNNTHYGVLVDRDSTLEFDASHNWWGNSTGPYHETLNPIGTGDNISDLVLFEPWLDEFGSPVYFPKEPESPNWPPLAFLVLILIILFSRLHSTIRTPSRHWGEEYSDTVPGETASHWRSPGGDATPDGDEVPGRSITCQYCFLPFTIPLDEQGIRVPCPLCGENTLLAGMEPIRRPGIEKDK